MEEARYKTNIRKRNISFNSYIYSRADQKEVILTESAHLFFIPATIRRTPLGNNTLTSNHPETQPPHRSLSTTKKRQQSL